MYRVFEGLPEEKKQRIIDAAVAEFAVKGYDNASTNSIVKEAGISKGILFHYFKTKRDLYKYVIFYSLEIMYESLMKDMSFESGEYFGRMLENSKSKLKFFVKHPDFYNLVVAVFKSNDKEIIDEIYAKYLPMLGEYFTKLNTGIDMSLFKEDVEISKVNEVVTWIAEGLSEKLMQSLPQDISKLEEIFEGFNVEFMKYMDIIKKGIYKKADH